MPMHAANGSGLSNQSNPSSRSSSTKHTSRSKSTCSKGSSKSQKKSDASVDSARTSTQHEYYTPSEPLLDYLEDIIHSNPGFSSTYTNALTYTYGFPQEPQSRSDLETEMIMESQARILAGLDEFDRWMVDEKRQK